MQALLHDLRSAARGLRSAPAITAAALLTLALGIGLNVALFSVVRVALLSPLPYHEPGSIVYVLPEKYISVESLTIFEEEASAFTDISAFGNKSMALLGAAEPESISVGRVTPSHFDVLGVSPHLGRGFEATDYRVTILSHELWQRRFGADENILGETVSLDEDRYTVVGVMPRGHRPIHPDWDAWVPLIVDPASPRFRNAAVYHLLARLVPRTSIDRARNDTRRIVARLHEIDPARFREADIKNADVAVLTDLVMGDVGRSLLIAFAAAVGVLLIGCVNVTHLLLARSVARRREIALRGALGADAGRLARLVLTEAALLVITGCSLGMIAAGWTLKALESTVAEVVPRYEDAGFDAALFLFALALALLVTCLVGLAPAWRVAGAAPLAVLGAVGRRHDTPARYRLSRALLTVEVALSVVLVICAILLAESLRRHQRVPLGFDPDGVRTLKVSLPQDRYADHLRSRQYFEEVSESLRHLAEVKAVGATSNLPITGGETKVSYLQPGRQSPAGERPPLVSISIVTPGFCETLGIPLLRGRWLTTEDRDGRPGAGLVNEALAQELWRGGDPLGKELRHLDGSPWLRVAGVVGNVRSRDSGAPPAARLYVPLAQMPWPKRMSFVVKGSASLSSEALRQTIWTSDERIPITEMAAMGEILADALADERRLAVLSSTLGALALVLAVIGVYGLTSHLTGLRRHEMAVRIAMGATREQLVLGALRRTLSAAVLGIGLGAVAALGLTRFLKSFLFEVDPLTPAVFVAVPLVLIACTGFAGWLPARRAARLEPAAILGAE